MDLYKSPSNITFHVKEIYFTVNPKIFARVLFSQNFAYAKFVKIKSSRNGESILSFTELVNHALVANFKGHKHDI